MKALASAESTVSESHSEILSGASYLFDEGRNLVAPAAGPFRSSNDFGFQARRDSDTATPVSSRNIERREKTLIQALSAYDVEWLLPTPDARTANRPSVEPLGSSSR